jgi:hypothetical protein
LSPKADRIRISGELQVFSQSAKLLLETYAKEMRIFVADESLAGSDPAEIRKMRADPESSWNMAKAALLKDLKREAVGLVNRIHIKAYTEGL